MLGNRVVGTLVTAFASIALLLPEIKFGKGKKKEPLVEEVSE